MRASIELSFLFGSVVLTAAPAFAAAMPPGIGTRLSIEGPMFVDARGMTLYKGSPRCGNDRDSLVRPIQTEGDIAQVVIAKSRSCLDKNPPLIAPANAQRFGKWDILTRKDGIRQWTYDGAPLFRSIKDRRPGDTNGGYRLRLGRMPSNTAFAPPTGLPAGLQLRETVAGLALADFRGKALYFRDGDAACAGKCARVWQPLAAAASAISRYKDWSIVQRDDGARQWAYKGQPLYTYVYDAPASGEQVFGDTYGDTWAKPIKGWNVAVLLPAPKPPTGVTVQTLTGETELYSFGLPKVVYADAAGRTLYTIHCIDDDGDLDEEGSGRQVACDDIGDDPRYWLSYCGGEARCMKTWRPLPAPPNAKPTSGVWSVKTLNPRHPYKPVVGGKGQRVWAYRGYPVFTYAYDKVPGDFYGDDHGFATTGSGQMQARVIPAHAHGPTRAPVIEVAGTAGRRRAK